MIAAGLATSLTGDELIVPDGEDRAYVRLLGTEVYEAWLIAWAPTGALDLHDHGGSEGAIRVVRGCLTEVYSDRPRTALIRTRPIMEGRGIDIPSNRIHEVWNRGPADAVSVHVYSPPLTVMTFFDRDDDGSVVASRTVAAGDAP